MTLRVLSLGAGVQSSTLLLLSERGEVDRFDCAVFADTGWEPAAVYDWLGWLDGQTSIPVHTVSAGNIRDDALVSQVRGKAEDGNRWASMPLFVLQPNGDRGQIRRQCTTEYKIEPIERFIRRELLGLNPGQRAPTKCVEQSYGISTDEMRRVRVAREHWKHNRYPLIELGMSRADCLRWWESEALPEPPRSACIGCPYRADAEWRRLTPDEFEDACKLDDAIRKSGGMRGDLFLHASRRPLREVDFSTDVEKGQGLMFPTNECDGICGT